MTPTPADLRHRLSDLPPALRSRYRRRLSGAERVEEAGRRRRALEKIAADLDRAVARRELRLATLPNELAYPEDLPITGRRGDLLQTIRGHPVTIVAGETGSGKSTQLPKLCLELGRGVDGLIGHTQPRRIAARAVAERIAEETGTPLGGLVGYTVRFTDQVGEGTLVKVMTDGILLNEIHHDRRLEKYDTIIIDEAHERSLNVDFLLGYLAALLPKRSDLKLIITSATIDTERFSRHFGDAPVVEVSGRSYPVEVRYRPPDDPTLGEPLDQPQAICAAVEELAAEGTGDVLVFCSGEREIRDAADALDELGLRHTEVLPLYARLSSAEQHRVFEPHRGRRIVLATNVAETSLTVPGIRYVVDAGTARISRYSRRTKVQQLPIEPISRASANQRAGRCGRTGPGICIRLYSEDDFASRPEFTEPEIQRTSLASVILQMAAIGLGEIESFPFIDPPDTRAVRDGIALLEELGAVDPNRQGSARWLTKLGSDLARLPVDPRLGRMLVEAANQGCLREAAVIVAALSIQDPRERPKDKTQRADELHTRFVHPDSDFLSWLSLWEYVHGERRARTGSQFRKLCREEFLNYRRLREWQEIHAQLRALCKELGFAPNRKPADPDTVHRALLSGLLSHVGRRDPDGYEYRGARGARFAIAPGSTLFKRAPTWVMAGELVETRRLWARQLAPIDPSWAEELGAHLVRRSYSDPWWDRTRGSAVVHETVTLYGIPLVTDRVVLLRRIDPTAARDLFIHHALVAGDWDTHHEFARHNQAAFEEVAALETRTRRIGLLADDEQIAAFFDSRVPDDVTSAAHFDAWWKRARAENPGLLDLSVDDLLDPRADVPSPEAYPEVWRYGDLVIPLRYEFEPTSATDGLTVDVPVAALDRVDPEAFEWLVPGLREELMTALIRSLPKPIRRELVPIPDTVRAVLGRLEPGTPLLPTLRRVLGDVAGRPVLADAFDLEKLPPHLRPHYRVVDDHGTVLAEGGDLAVLREHVAARTAATIDAARHPLEQDGLTGWSIGELPRHVTVGEGPSAVEAFPALVDQGDAVGIRLFGTRDLQAEAMWRGTRRLLVLHLRSPGASLRPLLTRRGKAAIAAGPHAAVAAWIEDCLACGLDDIMARCGGPAWDGVAFDQLLDRVRDDLTPTLERVGETSLRILELAASVRGAIRRMPDAHATAADDVAAQLDRLVYPEFLSSIGAGRLDDVARYLAAMEYRLERLADNPGRDAEAMSRVWRLEAEHERLSALLPDSVELTEIAWLLEELRVSLFAQPLGTRVPVSEKRLLRALAEAELSV